ncbi:hypothetical protein ACLOJK_002852 [Asimina triloba]
MPSSFFSRLNIALRSGADKAIQGLQNPAELQPARGRLLENSVKWLPVPFPSLGEGLVLSRSVASLAGSESSSLNQRRFPLVVGALSRTFAVPSVSGPACQVCIYHINQMSSNPVQNSFGSRFDCAFMASGGSLLGRAELGSQQLGSLKSGQTSYFVARADVSCSNRSMDYCRKARAKDVHSSCSAQHSADAAPNMSFDGSVRDVQNENTVASSDQKILGDRALKLLSGSCYLPHPDKEETGGEDAHFICIDEQAIGVADGVGGWADLGIDAGQYARELMSHSVNAIQEEPKGSIDPARVLEKAYLSTKSKGSSTACIVALTEQQGLHAVNLGDSGFIVVRDGCTVFRSPVQQHDFNFTYQLASGSESDPPSAAQLVNLVCTPGSESDPPSAAQIFTIPVTPGDVIIAGTDGLFDNLYNNEVTAVVVHAVRAGLGPQVTAQKIAALARQRAQDRDRQTPFSTAAQDAGYRYYGGKLDDITVVVSYITSSTA